MSHFDLNGTERLILIVKISEKLNVTLLFFLPEQLCEKVRTQCENSVRSEPLLALRGEEKGTPAESSCGCLLPYCW